MADASLGGPKAKRPGQFPLFQTGGGSSGKKRTLKILERRIASPGIIGFKAATGRANGRRHNKAASPNICET